MQPSSETPDAPTPSPDPKPKRHTHEFSGFWWHYGPYGPQDVHLHGCFEDCCDRTLVAEGRTCEGESQPHYRFTLGQDLPKAFWVAREQRVGRLRFYEAAH